MRLSRSVALFGALAFSLPAGSVAATPTQLLLNPTGAGADFTARYSQAVLIDVLLLSDEGPVVGEQVVIEVLAEGADAPVVLLPSPTDGTGRAVARLTLVNGRHGGATFPAAPGTEEEPGHLYTLTASYAGELDESDPACQPADAGTVDAGVGLCPSSATGRLRVTPENVVLELQPGNMAALGEDLMLIATLHDPNGDAPQGGTEIDGDEPKPVEGGSIAFFFDLDGNERPSADERLGSDATDANGIATLTFTVDPAIFPAGELEEGLHVQFGGDDRYALAGASGRVTITAGAVDPSRSVIEIEPDMDVVADGNRQLSLTGILVDEANNILGIDAPAHEVHFTATEGSVLGEGAVRDVLTGEYEQLYRVPSTPGDVTFTLVVDGTPGATRTLTLEPRSCACAAAPPGTLPRLGVPLVAVLVGALARRRLSPSRSRP